MYYTIAIFATQPSSPPRAGNSEDSFIHHDVFPLKVRREKNAGLHAFYARHLPDTIQDHLQLEG